MSDSYKQIAKRAPHGHLASPPPPQHLNSRGLVQRAIIAPLLIHGGGGLAPLAQQPPAAEPLYPFGESCKKPALSAQTWMVGSEDEERSLRSDERRAGRGDMLVDFDARTGHNHGTKFRLRQDKFPTLYGKIETIL